MNMEIPIIKTDDAHKGLLERDAAVGMAAQFKDAHNLLDELVNYGTNLIVRAFDSSKRDLAAVCVLFVQLRQFLMHLDGITILLRDGNGGTADLQLRSLLEGGHLIEWTLKKDTEVKVQHLYVANLRRRRHWNNSVVRGTPEFTKHFDVTAGLKITPGDLKDVTEETTRISSLLSNAPFDAIDAKFEQYYKQRGFDEPWYKVYGATSIRSIADELGKLKEYTYIYSALSGVTHGAIFGKTSSSAKGKLKLARFGNRNISHVSFNSRQHSRCAFIV